MSDYSFVEVAKARQRMCKQFDNCMKCPLFVIGRANCSPSILKEPEQSQEIIMQWAKEHPIKTNADKFKEVFGVDINYSKSECNGIDCSQIEDCDKCKYKGFWKQEYKE